MYNKLHREVIRDPRILGCAIISLFCVSIVWTPFSYKRRVYTKDKKHGKLSDKMSPSLEQRGDNGSSEGERCKPNLHRQG